MLDAETAAMLRLVLDEVCADISPFDTATRTHVASSLLEKTRQAASSLDDLRWYIAPGAFGLLMFGVAGVG